MLCLLQVPIRSFPGAVLAPVATVTALLRLEGNLGKAFTGLARHDFIAAFRNLVQAGSPAVEPKADGVHDRRLACAGRTGNGKYAIRCIVRAGEINLPFARE